MTQASTSQQHTHVQGHTFVPGDDECSFCYETVQGFTGHCTGDKEIPCTQDSPFAEFQGNTPDEDDETP